MATINRFQELDCWKKARDFENFVFLLTQKGAFLRDFGHKDQINKSTGSIMDNIAEGFCRGSNKEFINFLIYSRASAGEAQSQLYRALDRKYITDKEFSISFLKSEQVITSVTNFINFLKTKINFSYRKAE